MAKTLCLTKECIRVLVATELESIEGGKNKLPTGPNLGTTAGRHPLPTGPNLGTTAGRHRLPTGPVFGTTATRK
jgi:hypothetical protein